MKTRKLTSIALILCLLMSLVSVMFVGTASAETYDSSDNAFEYKTVLNLTFDGVNCGGIAMANANTAKIENGTFVIGNSGGAAGGSWIAKDGTVNAGAAIPNKTNVTDASKSPKANLFALEGNTTYRITYKYAYRNDFPEGQEMQFMAANDPYLSANHGRGTGLATYIATVADAMDAKAGTPTGEATFGELKEETFVFSTKSTAEGKFLGVRTSGGGANAYVMFDDFKVEKVVSNAQYKTVLDINFDSNTAAGIASTGFDTNWNNKVTGGNMLMIQNKGGGGSLWFGANESVNSDKTTIPSQTTYDADTAAELVKDCFELQPATTYKITFKYRYRDDAHTSGNLSFMSAINPYLKENHGRGSGISASIATTIDPMETSAANETFGGTSAWHEWREETFIFTTKDELTNKYLGLRPEYNSNYKIATQIDDFKIEVLTADIYTFDYKTDKAPLDVTADGVLYSTNKHYTLCNYGTEGGSYIDEAGLHFRPTNNTNGLNYDNFGWNHNALIYDFDVDCNGSHQVIVDANYLYIVTVKYKVVSAKGNGAIAIAVKAQDSKDYSTREVAHRYHNAASDKYYYLTGVVDAASISNLGGREIMLVGSAAAGTEYLVESVVVTAIEKDTADVALVKTDDANPYVYDVDFVKRGTEIDVPHTIIKNPTNTKEENAYNISYVNPSLKTLRIDTDGDDYVYTPNGTETGNTYLESYEDAERGTVVKISTSKGSGVSTSTFNFNEFKPEVGKKYYVTFDAKLLENNNKKEAALKFERLYYSGASGISQSGDKTHINADVNSKVTALTGITLTTEWKTYGWVLNVKEETGDAANRPYVSFAVPHNGTDKGDDVHAGVFVVDNFTVVEYTTEGAATAPNDATDAMASIRGYGVSADGSYQSAGLRFRATVDAATKAAASEIGFIVAPAKAATAYGAEWYAAEGELVAGVSALKQACYIKDTKDIVYSDLGDKGTAYQMILKGLSTEDGKTAFNQRFVAVMYVVAEDGTTQYYNLGETSYNEMLTAYGISGTVVPEV